MSNFQEITMDRIIALANHVVKELNVITVDYLKAVDSSVNPEDFEEWEFSRAAKFDDFLLHFIAILNRLRSETDREGVKE